MAYSVMDTSSVRYSRSLLISATWSKGLLTRFFGEKRRSFREGSKRGKVCNESQHRRTVALRVTIRA